MKKLNFALIGTVIGFLNGFFGSGGGLIAVPFLQKTGIETKKCHATSLALIFPLSVASTILYYFKGNININLALKFIPAGLLGAVVGSHFLKKINSITLKRIFAIILIISGIRLFLK